MESIEERREKLNDIIKLLEERSDVENPREYWKSWGLLDPFYVINEENNIIKYSWNDKSPIMTNCIVVIWDEKYEKCKLLRNSTLTYNCIQK